MQLSPLSTFAPFAGLCLALAGAVPACSGAPDPGALSAGSSSDAATTMPGKGGGTPTSGGNGNGNGNGSSDAGGATMNPTPADGGTPAQNADAGSGTADDASATDAATPPYSDGGWWRPSSATPIHYHWQLSAQFVSPADVVPGSGQVVYDIDGETNTAATVAALHALGPDVKVVCYVDVGTYENYRSDAASFPASVLGSSNGWPGEQWLDVRQQSVLLPIMKTRFQNWCVGKGFDAIEPDNLDGWQNTSGFPLTEADNVSYDLAIAGLAHSLGLSVGLKNVPSNAAAMEPSFDWALDEQCFEFNECDSYVGSFLAKGKAVWDVEYNKAPDCTQAGMNHMNAQMRDLNLVAPGGSGYVYTPCVPDSQTAW
jgi:hypothetical protein